MAEIPKSRFPLKIHLAAAALAVAALACETPQTKAEKSLMMGQLARVDDRVSQISKTMVAQADMAADLAQLQRAITVLTGQLEEFNTRAAMLTEKTDRLEKGFAQLAGSMQGDLVNRTAANGAAVVELKKEVRAITVEMMAYIELAEKHTGVSAKSHRKAVDSLLSGGWALNVDGQGKGSEAAEAEKSVESYQRMYLLYLQGDYNGAIIGFADFIKQYPGSALLDGALYWTGESYFSIKEYGKAVETFSNLVDKHPESLKATAATFRSAEALLELGEVEQAAKRLTSVVEKHPGSKEAPAAAAKLKTLEVSRPKKK